MKRAALYARVSSDLQKKEKTIESQLVELKKQINDAGDVLVKEYIDDGYSGARLDRPAMDELRKDLKMNVFDTIYFLNTDRIAREVTYQTIIIAEILKYKKQIIINGKDYVHNPENKFTVTVLGAVAELERAKIIERTVRARQHRLVQGKLLGCGNNIYGYDYHKRTPTSDPYYTINEEEARVVRYVFDTYANQPSGVNQITRHLEEINAPTKNKKGFWRTSLIKCMTTNEMYTGVRYFNTMKVVREYANPMHGVEHTSKKIIRRDRSEWKGIPVPAIISQKLFDKVQARIASNKAKYRNPRVPQLLSSLIRCGECGGSFFSIRSHYRDMRDKNPKTHHRVAYKCNWRSRQHMHHAQTKVQRCHNKEIKSEILEYYVFKVFMETVIEPTKIKKHMDLLKTDPQNGRKKLERQLKYINFKIDRLDMKKKRLVEVYASGNMEKNQYILKNLEYDNEIMVLKNEKIELAKRIPLLHKTEVINTSIAEYCEKARVQLGRARDFDAKRKFFLEHIDTIVFNRNLFEINGSVPIHSKEYVGKSQDEETGVIKFCVKSEVPHAAFFARKKGTIHFEQPITPQEYDWLLRKERC